MDCTFDDKDPRKEITLLKVIYWVLESWREEVKPWTISSCFMKSTLLGTSISLQYKSVDWEEPHELQILAQQLRDAGQIKEIMNMKQFINPEEEVIEESPEDLLDHLAESYGELQIEEEPGPEVPEVSSKEALEVII